NLRDEGGEPVADLLVRPAALRATEAAAAEVPTRVDEVPILAALASRATRETVFRQVGGLEGKAHNRLELVAANRHALGVGAAASAVGRTASREGCTGLSRSRLSIPTGSRERGAVPPGLRNGLSRSPKSCRCDSCSWATCFGPRSPGWTWRRRFAPSG